MRNRVNKIKTSTQRALTSSEAYFVNFNFGRAAAFGGFIVSLNTFIRPIKNPIAVFFAIFAPLYIFILLMVNEVFKWQFLRKEYKQAKRDKQAVEHAYVHLMDLTAEEQVKRQFPYSWRRFLEAQEVVIDDDMGPVVPMVPQHTNEKILAALRHQTADVPLWKRLIKYPTGFIDCTASAAGGASAMFINFVVVKALKDPDSEALKIAAIVMAMIAGGYFAAYSLTNTAKSWDLLEREKAYVDKCLGRLYKLFNMCPVIQTDPLYTDEIKAAFTLWDRKKNPPPRPVAAQEIDVEAVPGGGAVAAASQRSADHEIDLEAGLGGPPARP